MVASLSVAPAVSSTTVISAWRAKLAWSGVNAAATVRTFDTGAGRQRGGTCGSVRAVLLTLPSVKMTRAEIASRTSAQAATPIKTAKPVGFP